ncbi:hypothetical protein SAMD00019534_093460 [Acytostelium subglobosum LB1]|uniref:hypothetical protein n=1 Tax=Acytostelium subglobosum LB1 TaxID=1410327 RepID=UPI000644AF59|nr:hypothetical protein SAMD00019534_093460 [Acytostelium subglobosum LB1]GAM26171.1 hypothetical protein SAMD00019534_093460 [Acytostelium subglobosum LB1]|eukprot:XP_012750725.1 hypothetical protein SAMD00019534_093460 [Acytostelium subglobosum LB1]
MNNIKVSLGRKKVVTPSDELYTRIVEHSDMMDEIQKNLEKQQQHLFSTALHSKTISESFRRYGDVSSTFNTKIPLSDCMQRAAEWQNTLSDCFNHLGNVLYDRSTQPLKETIRIQLEVVKEGKKRLKKLAPNENTSAHKSMGPDFKRELDIYDRACKEASQLYNDSELALENSSVQTMLSAFEAYHDFFQKGAFQFARIKADIDNYRKVIMETNKVQAKLRNYIPRKTFGIKLEEVFARESNRGMPQFLDEIFKHLEKSAPTLEGIFRISAGKSSIETLQQKIESSQPLDLHTLLDPHIVSSVLKLFLRSLPEPLIFYSSYQKLISALPMANQTVLKSVLSLCKLIKEHKETTKMDLTNLAVVLAPTLLEAIPNLKAEDIQKPETFAEFNALFILLVENTDNIFPSTINNQDNGVRSRSHTEVAVPPSASFIASTTPISSNSNNNGAQQTSPKERGHAQDMNKPLPPPPPMTKSTSNLSTPPSPTQEMNTLSHSGDIKPPPSATSDVAAVSDRSPLKNSSDSSSNSSFSSDTDSSSFSSSSTASVPQPDQANTPHKEDKPTPPPVLRANSGVLNIGVHFMNINRNLQRLKAMVEETQSTEQGINLIKIYRRISDISMSIQKTTKFAFIRDKPSVNNDDDKISKLRKTLVYTHENNIDLIKDAKEIYERSEDLAVCKELERYIAQMNTAIIEELDSIVHQ